MTARPCRTGIVSLRTGTSRCQRGFSSRQIRPSTIARRSCGFSAAVTRAVTRSSGCAVGAVVGRACATQRNVSRSPPSGIHSRKSAKDMSASSCHSATTRWRCSTASPDSPECSASSSLSVDTAFPPPVPAILPRGRLCSPATSGEEEPCPTSAKAARPQEGRRQPRQASQHVTRGAGTGRRVPAGFSPGARSGWSAPRRWCVRPSGPDSTVTSACSSTAMRICWRSRSFSPSGRLLAAALAGQQPLELLVDAVLGQARPALVEVLGQQRAPALVALVVEEQPDLGEHLGAVGVVVVPAAHERDLLLARAGTRARARCR